MFKTWKKIISWLLVVGMVVTMLPTNITVQAQEITDSAITEAAVDENAVEEVVENEELKEEDNSEAGETVDALDDETGSESAEQEEAEEDSNEINSDTEANPPVEDCEEELLEDEEIAAVDLVQMEKAEGTCGPNLKWSLVKTGETQIFGGFDAELTITGTGEMYDFGGDSSAPWAGYNLNSIQIAEGVTRIGNYAFYAQSHYTELKLPSTLKSIGKYAFWANGELSEVELPDGLTSIGEYAFAGCNGELNAEKKGLTVVRMPDSVIELAPHAFGDDTALEEINLSNSLVKIGEEAFKGCYRLKAITIPNSVVEIGEDAFRGCKVLQVIEIPASVERIGSGALYTENKDTVISASGKWFDDNGNEVDLNSMICSKDHPSLYKAEAAVGTQMCGPNLSWEVVDGILTFTGSGPMTDYGSLFRVPWYNDYRYTITGISFSEGMTSIGSCAFYELYNLKSVVIPENIKYIGTSAFYKCGLEEAEIHAEMIDKRAFDSCNKLSKVILGNGVKEIGDNAFYNLSSLTNVTIADSVEIIGTYAFGSCSKLSVLELKDSSKLKYVESYAFYSCSQLASFRAPASLRGIGQSAFYGCSGLKMVTLNNCLETMAHYAFYNTGISELTIPASVSCIGYRAIPTGVTLKVSGTWYDVDGKVYDLAKNGCPQQSNVYIYRKVSGNTPVPTEKIYKITYVLNGGSFACEYPKTYKKGEYPELPSPVKTGYIFLGWYSDSKLTKAITSLEGLAKDVTVYAKWKDNRYTIKYDANVASTTTGKATGTMTATKLVYGNEENQIAANKFVVVGYDFAGWSLRADGAGVILTDTVVGTMFDSRARVNSNTVVLYAQWTAKPYTVTLYDGESELDTVSPVSLTKKQKLSAGAKKANVEACKPGYQLVSWNTKADGTGKTYKLDAADLAAPGESITLFAQWKPITYKISYSLNGGKATSASKKNAKSYNITKGAIVLKAPVKTNADFTGWSLNGEKLPVNDDGNSFIPEGTIGNLKLTATYNNWKIHVRIHENAERYPNLHFKDDYYALYESAELSGADENGKYACINSFQPGTSKNPYYTQDSWKHFIDNAYDIAAEEDAEFLVGFATTPNGAIKYAVGSNIFASITRNDQVLDLYPVLGKMKYRVDYNTSLGAAANDAKNPRVYNGPAAKDIVLKSPKCAGYIFVKWVDETAVTGSTAAERNASGMELPAITKVAKSSAADMKLMAVWKPVTYTVKLKVNNAKTTVKENAKMIYTPTDGAAYNTDLTFRTEDIIESNLYFDFVGWNTKANGKGTYINANAEGDIQLAGLSKKNSSTVTLYAIWKAKTYSVAFVNIDPDDASKELVGVTNKNKTSYSAAKTVKLSNPSKYGFTFKGWYTDEDCTKSISKLNAYTINENLENVVDTNEDGVKDTIIIYGKWIVK